MPHKQVNGIPCYIQGGVRNYYVLLPASAQEIADVIGRDAALYLIGQLPTCYAGKNGKRSNRVILYVPRKLTPDHRLVEILGWDTARQLVDAFGGEILQPANCNEIVQDFREREVWRMTIEQGMGRQELASIFDVSFRRVNQVQRMFRGPANDNIVAANDNREIPQED